MIQYRSVAALNRCVIDNLWRIPSNVDLVVGVPRSGVIPAQLLGLHLNLPVQDLDSYIEGLSPGGGLRVHGIPASRPKHVLVVEDSVSTGAAIAVVRQRLGEAIRSEPCEFLAVYVAPGKEGLVDHFFEAVGEPRIFEWNMTNHYLLPSACVDIDGVLCRDPTEDENDDGDRYREFILGAEPLFRPKGKIGWLVSARLEKYRAETEKWLDANGIEYGELRLMEVPDAETRRRLRLHAKHKGRVYRDTPSSLFLESATWQAREIAAIAGKSVVCTSDSTLYEAGEFDALMAKVARSPTTLSIRMRTLPSRVRGLLQGINGH